MSNLFLTLVIAFVIIVLALACLAIGWLITGKTKLEKSSCGRDPTQLKNDDCHSICSVCSTPVQKSPEDKDSAEKEDQEDTEQGDKK